MDAEKKRAGLERRDFLRVMGGRRRRRPAAVRPLVAAEPVEDGGPARQAALPGNRPRQEILRNQPVLTGAIRPCWSRGSHGGGRGTGMFGSVAAAAPMDRRAFLKRSGLAAGGLAAAGAVSSMSMVGKAEAGPTTPGVEIARKKTVCTHCSVGCRVIGGGPGRRVGRPGAGCSTARSTWARIAPRAPRSASSAMATAA